MRLDGDGRPGREVPGVVEGQAEDLVNVPDNVTSGAGLEDIADLNVYTPRAKDGAKVDVSRLVLHQHSGTTATYRRGEIVEYRGRWWNGGHIVLSIGIELPGVFDVESVVADRLEDREGKEGEESTSVIDRGGRRGKGGAGG